MKKFVWALALVATFGLSTQTVYSQELKSLAYTEVAPSYQIEEELLLGDTVTTIGFWCLGIGTATILTGGIIALCDETEYDSFFTPGVITMLVGLGIVSFGAGMILGPDYLAYSEVENNSAFKLCEISAPKQDDFNWAPIIASDFNGNMNYGAAMAYRF